jgi:hypothetical protein
VLLPGKASQAAAAAAATGTAMLAHNPSSQLISNPLIPCGQVMQHPAAAHHGKGGCRFHSASRTMQCQTCGQPCC